jgi:TonB family protein
MVATSDSRSVQSVQELVVGALQVTAASNPESTPESSAVRDDIELPILLSIDRPRFPRVAGRSLASSSGRVIVSVDLDEHGKPIHVAIAESDLGSAFDTSALRVVKAARYAPARKNGVPVSCTALVPVVFAVDDMAKRREIDPFTPPQMHKPRYYTQRNENYRKSQ